MGILLFICGVQSTYGQIKDSIPAKDTIHKKINDSNRKPTKNLHDTTISITKPEQKIDTTYTNIASQKNDTIRKDSATLVHIASSAVFGENAREKLLKRIKYINLKDAPVYLLNETRRTHGKEFLFYSIFILLLILGFLKTFYSAYFNNLFRVFFNTSLRQSQLTDQLLQAKLPSFLLNIFFIVSAGFYLWLLLLFYKPPRYIESQWLFPICIGVVAAVYVIKFLILKILGWVGDIVPMTNNYIFIIFLINKMIGIFLVPFIVVMAFMPPLWMRTAVLLSFLVVGLLFLARYAKSYALIDRQLKMNLFHFVIYAMAAEIIPMLLIFKTMKDYIL